MARTEKHINRDVKRQRKRNWRTKTAKDTARRKIEIQVQRHRITDRSRGARERERERGVCAPYDAFPLYLDTVAHTVKHLKQSIWN